MTAGETWVKVENSSILQEKGRMVFRQGGKQILLIQTDERIFAVNNRCPHEGYPLSEGSLSEDRSSGGCSLTCHWHNWKFDLISGDTVVGGDRLRQYPVRQGPDGVWVDLQDAPAAQLRQQALDNIQASFDRYEYDRMARELSRFRNAGGTYRDAVLDTMVRNYDRLEYGMGHAFAAAADWLAYATELEAQGREDEALAAVLEIIAHVAWDCRRHPHYPYAPGRAPYDPEGLQEAIEAEKEDTAIAMVRDALAQGLAFSDLEPVLARAAFDHYKGFGHAAIYVYKASQLAEILGNEAHEALVLSLVRYLIYANREDLIPEFRVYGHSLTLWEGKEKEPVTSEDFRGLSTARALARILQSSARPEELYAALQEALAWNLLHFALRHDQATDNKVADNVGWLDFTHGITFANAVRVLCGRTPDLWPRALLQMGCFVGRNQAYIDHDLAVEEWQVDNPDDFFGKTFSALLDHEIGRAHV